MKAGLARKRITPKKFQDIELSGFGFFLDRYPAQIEDNLYTSALVLEGDNKEKVALVSLDLIGVDDTTTKRIKDGIHEKLNLKPTHSIISGIHTHSGPSTLDLIGCGRRSQEYVDELVPKIVDSVVEANQNMDDATVGFNKGSLEGVIYNRTGSSTLDPNLTVMKISGISVNGMLINYACHPVVLGSTSRSISRDYPGAVADVFESRAGVKVLWTTGCCGDIDPTIRRVKGDSGTTRQDVYDLGNSIAQKVLEISNDVPTKSENVDVASKTLELPFKIDFSYDGNAEIAKFKEEKDKGLLGHVSLEDFAKYARAVEERVNLPNVPNSREVNLTGIKIGDFCIMGLPGEIYSSTGLKIKEKYPDTIVICYANGDVGYVPPREEFLKKGSYAAGAAQLIYNQRPFTEDCEEILLDGVYEVLEDLNK